MLTLSNAQMHSLQERQTAAFIARVHMFVEARLGRAVPREAVKGLFDRGASYGLVSEREYAGYIFIAAAADVTPPSPDPGWIREVMLDANRAGIERVESLFDEARRRIPVPA